MALQEVGCTDAIVFGENYHSPVVIRDDNRGIPLGKVAGRYDWETNGNVKNADNEASSQSWIMISDSIAVAHPILLLCVFPFLSQRMIVL